jgi:hypothetical protein
MRTKHLLASILALSLVLTSAMAQSLKPGTQAPPIKVLGWTKGEPVTEFKPGRIYYIWVLSAG